MICAGFSSSQKVPIDDRWILINKLYCVPVFRPSQPGEKKLILTIVDLILHDYSSSLQEWNP
uniref:Uncharacterized protein n=1 Tax=Tetranychus urticae TaxID=32264 RepID=T1KR77_TETUR